MGDNFYYWRRHLNPASSGQTFVEGGGVIDFGDVGLSITSHQFSPIPGSPAIPAAASISSVSISVQGANSSEYLYLNVGGLQAAGFNVIGDSNSGTIQYAVTVSGVTTWQNFATYSAGLAGQALQINLFVAVTDAATQSTTAPAATAEWSALDAVLDHVLYATTSQTPATSRTIQYSFGGTYAFGTPTVTVAIQPINSQPALTNTTTANLGTIAETASNQFQVSSFRQSLSDADGPSTGIAITGATSNNGHWEYRLEGTSEWIAFGTVSGSSTLLLKDTDWVRFVGDGSVVGGQSASNTITYRAWDQYTGTAGTKVDTTSLNGQSAYSSSQASASLTITGINAAPTITGATQTHAYTEGNASVALGAIVVADDDPGETVTVTLTLANPAAGVISGGGGTFTNGVWSFTGTVAAANTALAALSFAPATNNDVNTTIAVRVRDAGGAGPASDSTITLNVTPVEDIATITTVDVVSTEAKLPSLVLFSVASKVTIVDPDTDDAAAPTKYVSGSGSVSDIDGPAPPNGTLADLLTFDADTGQVIYDRSAFNWLGDGESVVYTITFMAKSGNDPAQQKSFTVTISGVNVAPTGAVTIGGTPTEDQTLTASHSLVDGDGLGPITYQWQRDTGSGPVDIPGATGTTYKLGEADVGATITVKASYVDGHGNAETRTSAPTAAVANVNDAPVLAVASPSLTGIDENETDADGQTVASFLGLTISDADAVNVSGIAIVGTTGDNGHWEYSLDGNTWEEIGDITQSSALLLTTSSFIRFVPNGENGTTATLSYRAWDQTGTELPGDPADTTNNGGSTPFSTGINTATLVVASLDDEATITTAPGIRTVETNLSSTVAFNLADKVTIADVDNEDAPIGYVAGSGTVGVEGPQPPFDTLLDLLSFNAATGAVSFDRSAFNWLADDECVEYTITFDARSGDDPPQEQTFTITIRGKNDAPVLSWPNHQTFVPMTEDDGPGAARTVLSFRGPISDDDHGAYLGIAITGTEGEGTWEFSLDNGQTWESFTACPENALLLRDTDLLRFVPDGKNGGEASFTYKAWDQTKGDAGCAIDTTRWININAFSTASDTVTLAVASINDAPVMTAHNMALFDITEDETENAGQEVSTFLCDAIADVDFGAVRGIALTGTTDGNGHWEYSLDGGASWTAVGEVGEDDALLLRHDDWVRFVPDGENGTTATLTYHAWDQTTGAAGDRVDLTTAGATGGTTAYSELTDTVSIAVSDENDAPVVSGAVTLVPEKEDTARLITQADLLVNATDVDTGATLEATDLAISAGKGQLTDNNDGTWTYTPEDDDDTSVSFTYKVGDGIAAAISTSATLDIIPVNDAPEAAPEITGGDEDSTISDSVGATDVDGQPLTYGVVTQAQHGTVTMNADGSYTYTPFADFNGVDSFTFSIFDGFITVTETANIVINPINDAPVNSAPVGLSVEAGYDIPITGLAIDDVDVGGALLTTTLSVAHGTVKIVAAGSLDSISGSGTAAVTLTGTLAAINATLGATNNVIYRTDDGFTGTDTLTLATADNGNTGAGGNLIDTDSVNLFWQHFEGGADDESYTAISGYQRIDAGGGTDSVQFSFKLTDASFSWVGNQVIVKYEGDQIILTGVEVFHFADGTVHNDDADRLVDDLYYYANNTDVWTAGIDADAHYHSIGWQEWRDPNAFFSTSFYLAVNADVREAGVDPLNHFHETGWQQGIQPSMAFDIEAFLEANPDIAAAGVDPLAHFLEYGSGEGRQPIALDALVASNGFDYVYYLQNNPDVAAAHVDPFEHYQTMGWQEGRNPNAFFDTNGYLATYGDVAAAGVNPLDHYHLFGWKEGRDPSVDFDTTQYVSNNFDVAVAAIDPLYHFLRYGQAEGRSPYADGIWG